MNAKHILATCVVLICGQVLHAEVKGRYVRLGAAISPIMSLSEIEVWSGGKNIVAGRPEAFGNDHLYKLYRGNIRELCDGNTDTEQRHVEVRPPGAGGYQDVARYYASVEIDLGKAMPIDKIDIYRARYSYKPPHWVPWDEMGWRYLVVLDEQRRIVSAEAFHVYQEPFPKNKGLWSFAMKAAKAPLAGRTVPRDSRTWLSEAEFIRDFLGKPVIDLNAKTTPRDRQRLKRFGHRNDPQQIAALGRKFFNRVDLDQPHLRQVKSLVRRKKYAEALEAFKRPFFKSIAHLNSSNAETTTEYNWLCVPDTRDEMRARDLANHILCDRAELTVRSFTPGLMPLAQFNYPFKMRPLLTSYIATKDKAYLRAWEALTDDWALAFQNAADRDPAKLRDHFVLISGPIRSNLADLANAAQSHPRFVRELSGATLARFLIPVLEEAPVSIWRVTRKCVFNHTFNAVGGSADICQALSDFRAGQRLTKEMRQGMQRIHTLALYRDGAMVECNDEGHFIFGFLTPSRRYGRLCVTQPDYFTPAREAYFLAQLRNNELAAFRHTSPSGIGSRWEQQVYNRYPTCELRYDREYAALQKGDRSGSLDGVCGLLQRMSVVQEAGPRAVAEAVYDWGHHAKPLRQLYGKAAGREPSFVSDFLPYAGWYYFRSGWDRSDAMLHMIKPAIAPNYSTGLPNQQYQGWEELTSTSWRFQDYGTPLVSMFGTQVDKQVPCPQYGREPSGSKQNIFTQAVEKPQPRRWHTDDQLDLGEAVYEGVYHYTYRFRRKYGDQWNIEYEDDPVTIHGVTTTRQVFQIRPARLFLQVERVKYATPEESHTNRTRVSFVLCEPDPKSGEKFSDDQFRIDRKAKRIITRNPGSAGVTLGWFGQPAMTFKQLSINSTDYGFWPQKFKERVDPEIEAKFPASVDAPYGKRRTTGRGVFAYWNAAGESVLLSALRAHMSDDAPIASMKDISTDTAAGTTITMADGVVVTLLSARAIPAVLTHGDVRVTGEALLVVEQPGEPAYGIALGAADMRIAGKPFRITSRDFRFDVAGQGLATLTSIHRPLDPPTIAPGVNTFTDTTTVTLSTSSADAEIRYTTKQPASRMNAFRNAARRVLAGKITVEDAARKLAIKHEEGADWQVYTGPFEIDKDTVVRARTFRKGVREIPAMVQAGTDVSAVSFGFFHKRPLKPAAAAPRKPLTAGLDYDYLEDRWFALWTYTDVLPAKTAGKTAELLDVSMRATDGPFAVRYIGYVDIPKSGVYTFHGPDEFINNTCEPGYDLRVYIDDEEWDLGQTWHGRGQWSVPLAKGLHRLMVTFADARAKDIDHQRIDLWSIEAHGYPQPRTTWRGTVPTLEVSGPGMGRQPLPNAWLKRTK